MYFRLIRRSGSLKTYMHNLLEEITSPKPAPLQEDPELSRLQDLKQFAILRMHELDNSQLLQLTERYSQAGELSPSLYDSIRSQIQKKLHSFSITELSDFAGHFSNTKRDPQMYSLIEHRIMEDAFSIEENSAAILSYSFAKQCVGSNEFWNILKNIWISSWENFSSEQGLLFISGLVKRKDTEMNKIVQKWAEKNINEMKQTQIVHLLYALVKLQSSYYKEIETYISADELPLELIEKLLGVFHVHKIQPGLIGNLLDVSLVILNEQNFNSNEIAKFIYTIKHYPNSEHLAAINRYVVEQYDSISSDTKSEIFRAIISTSSENEDTLNLLKQFIDDTEPSFIPKIAVALLYRQDNVDIINDLTIAVLKHLRGLRFSTSEFSLVLCSMIQLGCNDSLFFKEAAQCASKLKIRNAEEYMEVYMTLKQINKHTDVSNTLEDLQRRYEA